MLGGCLGFLNHQQYQPTAQVVRNFQLALPWWKPVSPFCDFRPVDTSWGSMFERPEEFGRWEDESLHKLSKSP